MRELKTSVRSLLRRPTFTGVVVATLTIGIGATSAIFSVVDAVLLKPLPYPAADQLVAVYESNVARRQATALVAPGRLEEWNRMNQTFSGLAATYFENMTDTSGPIPERIEAMRISPRFFTVMGVAAALGRTVAPEEELFGGRHVVVLSEAFWRRRFNGDPAAIGRTFVVGGTARTVIGVMPPTFRYPTPTTEMWIPTQAPAFFLAARGARLYTAVGRLRPGVAPEQAQADLTAVQARLATEYPTTDAGWAAVVVPLQEVQVGGVRNSLRLLMVAVSVLLLAACANIACVMLADGIRREQQVAVRYALGASRARITRDILAEAVVLAGSGGVAGFTFAACGVAVVRYFAPTLPRLDEIAIDARSLAFTLLAAGATLLAFAVGPALHASRADIAPVLGRASRTSAGNRQKFQRLLVAAQIAFAIVLLSAASLLFRTFMNLRTVSPGFDAERVLTFRLSAQWSEPTDAVMGRQRRILARLAEIPGVTAASFATILPAGLDLPPGEFAIEGRDPSTHLFAYGRSVSADYFRTLRIPLLQGTTCADDPGKPFQRVVVTRRWADMFFPGENPIGHIVEPLTIAGLRQEVVGVVGDVRENGLANDPPPLMYTCGLQPYWPDPHYLVGFDPHRPVSANTIRVALAEIEPSRAIYAVRLLRETLDDSIAQRRLNAVLLAAFSSTTVLLAAIGMYGVLSQLVGGKRREIGIRMALGAPAASVIGTIAIPAAAMVVCGIAAGVGGALVLARMLATLVVGVSAGDPLTFVFAPIVTCIAATIAAILPARRAVQIDPVVVLRDD